MSLLFLIVLGTASVKAQVRIGGNTAPSAAAVLDLNAGNDNVANTGTGGLVLPRVDLKTNVMQLTAGVANQTGTMVYNVTTTLGRIGVYYWNGNSWVLASLPSTSAGDSGLVLMSTGSGVKWSSVFTGAIAAKNVLSTKIRTITNWQILIDTLINEPMTANGSVFWDITGIGNIAYGRDFCWSYGSTASYAGPEMRVAFNRLYATWASFVPLPASWRLICVRILN